MWHHKSLSQSQPDLLDNIIHSISGLLLVLHQKWQWMWSVTSLFSLYDFTQRSAASQRSARASATCPLSAGCLLQQQGKQNLPHFKAMCNTLLPVWGGWIRSPTAEKKFPSTIRASKMPKIMVYVHPVPKACSLCWWLLHQLEFTHCVSHLLLVCTVVLMIFTPRQFSLPQCCFS